MLRRGVFGVAILCLSLLAGGDANGQVSRDFSDVDTAGLVIEAVAGWSGFAETQRPVPIAMLVENFSDETFEGRVHLVAPWNDTDLDLGEIFIGPNSKRRFSAIRGDLEEFYECYIEIRCDYKVVWRRQIAVNTGNQFSSNTTYALLIDDDRTLNLPTSNKAKIKFVWSNGVAGENGRRVESLTAKSWQVPNHSGPLSMIQAIFFADQVDAKFLNRAQWGAIADWLCQGGTLFVHEKSNDVIERLLKDAPLSSSARTRSDDGFMVRTVGLGRILEYDEPLFSSEGKPTRQKVVNALALLPKTHIRSLLDGEMDDIPGNAEWNRFLMFGFFGIYTLFSGVIMLLLFRLNRKQVATYIIAVVACSCVAAIAIGGALRFSLGSVNWISITQPGTGGLMQVARLDAESAGARATKITVTGDNIDLQAVNARRRWRSWRQTELRYGFPAFTWTPDLDKEDNSHQLEVAMTPWGTRYLHATAFKPGDGRVDFKLEYEPSPSPASASDEDNGMAAQEAADNDNIGINPTGKITLRLKNNLPFDLVDCRVFIGVTAGYNSEVAQLIAQREPWRDQPTSIDGDRVDVYHCQYAPKLSANDESDVTFDAAFATKNSWDHQVRWKDGWIPMHRLQRIGTATAWLVARIKKSPSIAIDEANSSFSATDGMHVYFQEILPEDMPDAKLFFKTKPQPQPEDASD